MPTIASLASVINLKSLLISAVAVFSTWLCLRLGITADFPLTLIATAIVFPLVFSISTAYTRREKALEEYANLKGHGRALHLAARDWLDEGGEERAPLVATALGELLSACRDLFTSPIADMQKHERRVYDCFAALSLFARQLRADGLAATECSRWNQYVARMIVSFENIKHIFEYRTPRTLRAFSDFFILLLPIIYGPYFAFQADQFSRELFYVMPVLFSLILVGLANIQDHLENPFDQIGEDDVAIDPESFVASLVTSRRGRSADRLDVAEPAPVS